MLQKLTNKLRMPDGSINPWVIALTVTLATFMEVLDTSIANVAFAAYPRQFVRQRRRSHLGADFVLGFECDRSATVRMAFLADGP